MKTKVFSALLGFGLLATPFLATQVQAYSYSSNHQVFDYNQFISFNKDKGAYSVENRANFAKLNYKQKVQVSQKVAQYNRLSNYVNKYIIVFDKEKGKYTTNGNVNKLSFDYKVVVSKMVEIQNKALGVETYSFDTRKEVDFGNPFAGLDKFIKSVNGKYELIQNDEYKKLPDNLKEFLKGKVESLNRY